MPRANYMKSAIVKNNHAKSKKQSSTPTVQEPMLSRWLNDKTGSTPTVQEPMLSRWLND